MNAQLKPVEQTRELWAVLDKRPNADAFCYASEQLAQAKAKCWDLEYPGLAPHRVVRFVEARS